MPILNQDITTATKCQGKSGFSDIYFPFQLFKKLMICRPQVFPGKPCPTHLKCRAKIDDMPAAGFSGKALSYASKM
jgi:hypothetical protein